MRPSAPNVRGENAPSADGLAVYLQHVGRVEVESVAVPPDYEFGFAGDIAVLKLAEPVTGVTPTPINDQADPGFGTETVLVGFGTDDTAGGGVAGIKRTVQAETRRCVGGVPGAEHLCYIFAPPVGPPGEDGSSCFGDSGGPTFATIGGQKVLAGVTSGGASCKPPNAFGFDTNVYANRDWLAEQIGDDLNPAACGSLPEVGSADTAVIPFRGYVHPTDPVGSHSFEVGSGVDVLRLTLNSGQFADARLRRGSVPTPDQFDCQTTNVDGCEIDSPAAGTWHLEVEGVGDYQATVSLFYPAGSGAGQGGLPVASDPTEFCVPSLTTLCVDADELDRRFQVEVAFDTALGAGASGKAFFLPVAAPLSGGVLYFFSQNNPEMLVKVLDGCDVNDHYWVFLAAATTIGFELTVTDRVTGIAYRRSNPDGQQAQPFSDVRAFACE